jgi:hypothetical protein
MSVFVNLKEVQAMKRKPFRKFSLGIMILALTGFLWGCGLENELEAKNMPEIESKTVMVPVNFSELSSGIHSDRRTPLVTRTGPMIFSDRVMRKVLRGISNNEVWVPGLSSTRPAISSPTTM